MKALSEKSKQKGKAIELVKPATILIFFLLLVSNYSNAQQYEPQNIERKGFFLGIGLGPGIVSYKGGDENFNFETEKQNKVAFMSDFKIGYAPTDNLAIYWMSKVAWFNEEGDSEDKTLYINGVGGLGVSYFVKNNAPSPYLNGGIGYTTFRRLDEIDGINYSGLGISAGAGYEFVSHWSAEINITYGRPSYEEAYVDIAALRLTVNYLLY